jgi:Peptidase family M23/Ricin-type beta-trefoil lectin domain
MNTKNTTLRILSAVCLGMSSIALVAPKIMAETFSIDGIALNTNNGFPLKDGHPIMSTWPLSNTDNDQQFDVINGNQLRHKSTGKCLNAYQPANGSKVNVYPCNVNDGDQKFTFIAAGNNIKLIQRAGTSLCLDMPNRNANTQIILWDCNSGNANQRFVSNAGSNPPPTSNGDTLTNSNAIMLPGSSIESRNKCFRLSAQNDGNLVVYRQSNNQALWHTGTYGRSVKHTIFQTDGNLVIYDPNNNPIWNTGTYGRGATRLTMQDDGNLVIYNSQNQPLWATNTVTSCIDNSQTRDLNANYLPWQAGYSGRVDQAWGARVNAGGVSTHGSTPLALDFTVEGDKDVWTGSTYRSIIEAAAVRSGVVEWARYTGVYGNTVIIRHDDGNKSQYSHLYNFSVTEGQRVVGGQKLGLIGMTGLSRSQDGNGVHLHFQMMNQSNQLIQFSFKDAQGANFNVPGLSYTSQNR